MTLNEFLHWLEGFSEGINKAPTEKQWEKIKEHIHKIEMHEKNHEHERKEYEKKNIKEIIPGNIDYSRPIWQVFPNQGFYCDLNSQTIIDNCQTLTL